MTFTGANDADGPGGPCMIDMSVLDLAVFLRIHRSSRGTSAPLGVPSTVAVPISSGASPRTHRTSSSSPSQADPTSSRVSSNPSSPPK